MVYFYGLIFNYLKNVILIFTILNILFRFILGILQSILLCVLYYFLIICWVYSTNVPSTERKESDRTVAKLSCMFKTKTKSEQKKW